MTGGAGPHRKGAKAELEVQGLLRDLLGVPARRMLGAGRKDDIGDILGVPNTTLQVCDWQDINQALRHKPEECEHQRVRAGTTHAATFIRMRGGVWRVAQTPEQWATTLREAW